MKRCLIIFAKEPQDGNVKTRLKGYLSKKQRINLYKAFLKDTLRMAKSIKCENTILAYESSGRSPLYLKSIEKEFVFYQQKGQGLGKRMHDAFRYANSQEYSKIIIIGSDSPTLPPYFIKQAFKELNNNDAVLGPSPDGGFYLIGVKKPCYSVFKGIKWSSDKVFLQTIRNLRNLNKETAILPFWYDVDDFKGLSKLKEELAVVKNKKIAPWTRRFLKA